MLERTLSIVKPNAIDRGLTGEILSRFEKAGMRIVAAKMLWLSPAKAQEFYKEHEGKPFFEGLVEFMVSGPVLACVLEGEDVIKRSREIMGVTDPTQAAPGTIRKDFAENTRRNAIHGSDSVESAKSEISFFFSRAEMFSYPRR